MTTVSVVECLSPISLRTCGSSVSSLAYNRRKLHGTSPAKRVNANKLSSPDLRDAFTPYPPRDVARDLGLEKALTSSPLQSPIPRATPSTLGCMSRNTIRRSPSVSSLESDEELNNEIWRPHSPDTPDNLYVVGSKPRLHGMWQVPDLGSVTPSRVQQAVYPTRDDALVDLGNFYDNERMGSLSPENPPPSPVNFRAGMSGVVVGGQKLSYPERTINTPENSRDFTPGFVKKPLHHCLKCEGRVKEEELTQVTLHRRLSSILNNHMVQNLRHEEALLKSHSMRDFRRRPESHDCSYTSQFTNASHEVLNTEPSEFELAYNTAKNKSVNDMYSRTSFTEMYAMKRREKDAKEAEVREKRERKLKEKRSEEIRRLKEKIYRKSERSHKALSEYRDKQSRSRLHSRTVKQLTSHDVCQDEENEDHNTGDVDYIDETHLLTSSPTSPLQQPTSPLQQPTLLSQSLALTPVDIDQPIDLTETPQSDDELHQHENIKADDVISVEEEEKRVNRMAKHVLKKSWSDVFPCQRKVSEQFKNHVNATEAVDQAPSRDIMNAKLVGVGVPVPTVNTWTRYNDNSSPETITPEPPTISPPGNTVLSPPGNTVYDVKFSDKLDPLTPAPSAIDQNNTEDSQEEITMSATVIVPQRDTHCSQWITFNGDNEPVINYGPEKEDGCETFLKRLQKAKLCNQNDPSLPSGQQFCFEAMVDKRYNRWKRRRRKKQSEARRVVQSSESSDENDDRNSAMERIIDKMYEQIHGPVPRTPNGSRETPRVRRRRKDPSKDSQTMAENTEEPTLRYYDASSEWTSDGCLLSSSSCNVNKQEHKADDEKLLAGSQSDELCSWPYLEQYKSEILKRLQSTPPEQFKQFENNDWLPELDNTPREKPEAGIEYDAPETEMENNIQDRPDNEEVEFDLNANEDTILSDERFDTDNGTEEYEPYIRVDETPRNSPISPRKMSIEHTSYHDLQNIVDPENHTYSYKKWSRSQRTTPSKISTPDLKPRLLSRMSVATWSDVGSETADCVSVVSVGDRQRTATSLKPVQNQDVAHSIRDERRSRRKSQKVAMPIKKQNVNVNLPSLTRNSRSQTVPYTGSNTENRMIKTMKTSQRFQTNTPEDSRRFRNVNTPSSQKGVPPGSMRESQTMPNFKGSQTSTKDPQTMPDFLFRDYYLRSLYGNKVRMNSHIDANTKNKRLKKTLTVDNLELKSKKVKKKPPENIKPSSSSFTRSFTFSMFDLPNMYKVHNDNLERQANGETIEAYD